jgi:Na+-transporting NADH:ubiquinone oxidoreductase subunit NqrF
LSFFLTYYFYANAYKKRYLLFACLLLSIDDNDCISFLAGGKLFLSNREKHTVDEIDVSLVFAARGQWRNINLS